MTEQVTEQVETPEVVEEETQEVEIPEWVIDNIQYQARERYLEEEHIPGLTYKINSATGVVRELLRQNRTSLKDLASERHKATRSKALKQDLMDINMKELQLIQEQEELKNQRDAINEELGLQPKVTEARNTVTAIKDTRYTELDANVEGFRAMGTEPLKNEAELVAKYKAKKKTERQQIRNSLLKNR